jgi:putative transposase
MKFAFVCAEKASFPVALMCRRLEVSRSGYYAWARRPECEQARSDRLLAVEIAAVHEESRRRYGAPRVHEELRARGRQVARKRVARLMREQKLAARRRRRFVRTTDSAHPHPVAPNVLERDFSPPEPKCTWVGDITYVWTGEGWLYLAILLDLFSRKVVGWATSDRIDCDLVLSALASALHRGSNVDGLVHTRTEEASTPAASTSVLWMLEASGAA